MSEDHGGRYILRIVILTVLIICLIIISRTPHSASFSQQKPAPRVSYQSPPVSVQNDSSAPVHISLVGPSSTPEDFEYAYYVVNGSKGSIRAYTIKQQIKLQNSQSVEFMLNNLELTRDPLPPNKSDLVFDTYPATSETVTGITISIDYVEFTDGSTWGEDQGQGKDRFQGQREGCRTLLQRLSDVSNPSDVEKVLSSTDASMTSATPAMQHSNEWLDGFNLGYRSGVAHLKQILKKEGEKGVNRELKRWSMLLKGGK